MTDASVKQWKLKRQQLRGVRIRTRSKIQYLCTALLKFTPVDLDDAIARIKYHTVVNPGIDDRCANNLYVVWKHDTSLAFLENVEYEHVVSWIRYWPPFETPPECLVCVRRRDVGFDDTEPTGQDWRERLLKKQE